MLPRSQVAVSANAQTHLVLNQTELCLVVVWNLKGTEWRGSIQGSTTPFGFRPASVDPSHESGWGGGENPQVLATIKSPFADE